MQAMLLKAYQPVAAESLQPVELPTPHPGAGEVLIRVRACGVCRTDLHVIEGELKSQTLPIIPGHQVVGAVEAFGENCRRFAVGSRVGVPWLGYTCGECEFCASHRENLCPNSRYTGYHLNGGYAEYIVANEDYCYEIPDALTDVEAAPLLCAGIIGYRALARSQPRRGGALALFGFGSSAHITYQIARHRGLSVYVSTRGATHQQMARDMGAAWVGDTFECPPDKVDSVIVFAPVGEVIPIALRALKPGGTVSIAGIHSTPIPAMTYEEHLFHEKTLCSVEANTREDGRAFLAEAAQAGVRVQTESFPLAAANDALLRLKRGEMRGSGVLVV